MFLVKSLYLSLSYNFCSVCLPVTSSILSSIYMLVAAATCAGLVLEASGLMEASTLMRLLWGMDVLRASSSNFPYKQ